MDKSQRDHLQEILFLTLSPYIVTDLIPLILDYIPSQFITIFHSSCEKFDQYHWTTLDDIKLDYNLENYTLVSQNGRIYFLGGPSCSILDIENKKWISMASMLDVRDHFCTWIYQHLIYVFGGSNQESSILSQCMSYDIRKNSWSYLSVQITKGRAWHTGVGLKVNNTEKFFILGGCYEWDNSTTTNTCECFNPKFHEWESIASMNKGRNLASATSWNHTIFIFGGVDSGGDCLDSYERYDSKLNTWTIHESIKLRACSSALVVTIGDRIYHIGGFGTGGYSNVTLEFDPFTGEFREGASMKSARLPLGCIVESY